MCGRIQIRTYNDKEGVKKWITEIIVESFDFPPKNDNSRYSPDNSEGNNHPSTSSIGYEVNLDEDPF